MRCFLALLTLGCWSFEGQSERETKPPVIPPACVSLPALLSSPDGRSLSPRDETRLDTARIQTALDRCGAGHSVRLSTSAEGKRAFLASPIELRSGVALVVEKGVTVRASREAQEFQRTPGSCGVVNDKGQGCRPLLSCQGEANASVMGEGVIDERGGAAILGETYSWWDLAGEARLKGGKLNAPGLLMLRGCDNFTLYRITFRDPACDSLRFQDGGGLLVWGAKAYAPPSLPDAGLVKTVGARNVRIIESNFRELVVRPGK